MYTEIIDGKRRGKDVINYKEGVNLYIRDMLIEIGFRIEKNTGKYIRVSMEHIGEIVIHKNNNSGDGLSCVNVYLPGLRSFEILMYSGSGLGVVTYRYIEQKVEREKMSINTREFTDKILEQIRKVWEGKRNGK